MTVTLHIENVEEAIATRLEERAGRSGRSLQEELLRILEQAVAERERPTPGQVVERVRELKLETSAEAAAFVRRDRETH